MVVTVEIPYSRYLTSTGLLSNKKNRRPKGEMSRNRHLSLGFILLSEYAKRSGSEQSPNNHGHLLDVWVNMYLLDCRYDNPFQESNIWMKPADYHFDRSIILRVNIWMKPADYHFDDILAFTPLMLWCSFFHSRYCTQRWSSLLA